MTETPTAAPARKNRTWCFCAGCLLLPILTAGCLIGAYFAGPPLLELPGIIGPKTEEVYGLAPDLAASQSLAEVFEEQAIPGVRVYVIPFKDHPGKGAFLILDVSAGYRGLFGREIGADQWLLMLVSEARRALDWQDAPLLLYGHSAGGQFAARFLVSHPEELERVVISAALTYPAPDLAVAWPYGPGPYQGEVAWEDETRNAVNITPDLEVWEQALLVPTTVIVGLYDQEPQLSRPGQTGTTRIEIGRGWVNAMQTFGA
jgi:hypothetical protein